MNKAIRTLSTILFVSIVLLGVLVISTNKLYAYVDFGVYDYKVATIENGWNLIPASYVVGYEKGSFWYFNPTNKKYVEISDDGNSNNLEEVERLVQWLDNINIIDFVYELSVPVWFYKGRNLKISPNYKTFTYRLDRIFGEFNFSDNSNNTLVHLYKGWNLLLTNPIILDYPLEEYAGSCDNKLSSIYYFNSSKQNWDKLRINSDGILKNNGRDLPLGAGIALKVSKDCKFDYASIGSKQRTVPSLPNN